MARIRSVHPGLSTDEAYMEMSIAAKAAWPLLWTVADDRGVFDWKPKGIKAAILPADNVDMAAILEEWKSLGVIRLVEIDGKPCGLVKNFCRFQSPKFPSHRYELTEDMIKFVRWTPKKTGKGDGSTAGDSVSDAGETEDKPSPPTPEPPHPIPSPTPALPPGEERRGEEKKERTEATPLAASPPPSPLPASLWSEGLAILRRISGGSESQCRGQIGKWRKALREDDAQLFGVIHEAETLGLADPMAWLERAIQQRSGTRQSPVRQSSAAWMLDDADSPITIDMTMGRA